MQGCATLFLSRGNRKAKLEYIFDLYDANNDGFLSLEEIEEGFKALFSMIGKENAEHISHQMAETTMSFCPDLKIKKGNTSKIVAILPHLN